MTVMTTRMRRQSDAAVGLVLVTGLLAIFLALMAPGPVGAAATSNSALPLTASGLADRALDVLG